VVKPTDPSQKKSMGWLVGIGLEVVDESMNDSKHSVLHSACSIKVAPFKNAVLWAEHSMHCIGPHNAVEFGFIQIRNLNGNRTLTVVSWEVESRLQRPIDLCWAC
jgi:hypothetical protein